MTDSLLRYRAGAGPSVVLLPGLGADWQVWEPIIPGLARRTEVFVLDLPGLGRPPRDASGSTVQGRPGRSSPFHRQGSPSDWSGGMPPSRWP